MSSFDAPAAPPHALQNLWTKLCAYISGQRALIAALIKVDWAEASESRPGLLLT